MKQRRFLSYLVFLFVTFAVAVLSSIFVSRGIPAYEALRKPPLTPPAILFPIVWSILYTLMAVGAARVWNTGSPNRAEASIQYFEQLLLNGMWSLWFFEMQFYLLAFLWLVLLIAMILLMIMTFYPIDRKAALIQLPYLLWCLFAAYLNFMVWFLNR